MKNKKIIMCLILFLIAISIASIVFAEAPSVDTIISNMGGVTDPVDVDNPGDTGIGKVINIIIGLLQVAGSGISVIMVAVLGIKYILASAGEKAEIKKQATPIVIGAVLLFGAVNLMKALEEFAITTLS